MPAMVGTQAGDAYPETVMRALDAVLSVCYRGVDGRGDFIVIETAAITGRIDRGKEGLASSSHITDDGWLA